MTQEAIHYTHYSDLPSGINICIYGTGAGGAAAFELLKKYRPDIQINAFADTYNQGSFESIPILSPSQLSDQRQLFDLVLVCSCYAFEIARTLLNHGISNYNFFSWPVLRSYQFLPHELEEAVEKIRKITNNLESENDKNLFAELINFRSINSTIACVKTKDDGSPIIQLIDENRFLEVYPTHTSLCYFDFIDLSEIKFAVQGGVCDGREAAFILKNCPLLDNIIGFDPFGIDNFTPENAELLNQSNKFKMFAKGLWSKSGKYNFSNLGEIQASETASTNNETSFEVCSLDETIKKIGIKQVDLLFCDIENSELPMLKGAINTIQQSRTQLAISFYHSKEQFLKVPLFLIENLNDYIFKVGHYAEHIGESVFYAIPKEKYSGHHKD